MTNTRDGGTEPAAGPGYSIADALFTLAPLSVMPIR